MAWNFVPGDVVGIFGQPRQGKTYRAVSLLLQARAADPFVPVWSNIPLALPGLGDVYELDGIEAWEAAAGGVVLVDEANLLLGSRGWAGKERQRVAAKLDQLRKAGVVLLYTTHTPAKVDIRLRELTTDARYVSNWRSFGFFLEVRKAGLGSGVRADGFAVYRRSRAVEDAYNTLLAVGASGFAGWENLATRPRPRGDYLRILDDLRAERVRGRGIAASTRDGQPSTVVPLHGRGIRRDSA